MDINAGSCLGVGELSLATLNILNTSLVPLPRIVTLIWRGRRLVLVEWTFCRVMGELEADVFE